VKSCETLVARRSREQVSLPEIRGVFDLSLLFAGVCTAQLERGSKANRFYAAVGVSEETRSVSMGDWMIERAESRLAVSVEL
jgi:hypothetical protein